MKYGEPWRIDGRRIRDTGDLTIAIESNDAARIVSAINACAGLDLPADVPVGALAELVKACRGIDGVQKEGEIWSVNPSEFKAFKSAVRAALAALEAL